MDVAQRVLSRLERIEELEREQARPALVLAELRGLLAEAEVWVRTEGSDAERARSALERCREALEGARREERNPTRGGKRTLLA